MFEIVFLKGKFESQELTDRAILLNRFFHSGLRSHTLHEKMATIVNMTTFLRENPFPFFVNAAVLRLCETFRDELVDF